MESLKKPHVLVTGIMRSGTTFVGDILSKHDSLFYIHEPFSKQTGIEGVEHWFPYCNSKDSYYSELMQSFFNLKYKYKYFEPIGRGLLAKQLKKIIGGSAAWSGWEYKHFRKNSENMLIKDPLSSLLTHWYIKEYGIKAVYMVRHPLAFYYSNKRLGWDFDLSNLTVQKSLMADFFSEEEELLTSNLNYPQRLAILWKCIYKYFSIISKELPQDRLYMVRHEDLCAKPTEIFEGIFEFLNLEMDNKIKNRITNSTSIGNTIEAGNVTHLLNRDSNSLKNYWVGKITDEEKNYILPIVGETLDYYYSDKS